MPILVSCPKCGAKLNAPDSAAGKKVRCAKAGCGAIVPVPELLPAAEVVEPLPAPPPPPPPAARPAPPPVPHQTAQDPSSVWAAAVGDEDDRPKSKRRRDTDDDEEERPRSKRRRDDDDDQGDDDRPQRKRRRDEDDDDYDDRPQRKRYGSRGRSRANSGKLIAIVAGLLLLVGGVGAAVYFLAFAKSSPPKGWKEYTYADAGFKAYFPKEPQMQNMGGLAGMGGMPGMGGKIDLESFNVYQAGDPGDPPAVVVMVVRFKSGSSIRNQVADSIRGSMNKSGAKVDKRTVSWLGVKADEISDSEAKARIAVTDTGIYMAAITGGKGKRASSAEENGFFDNFVLVK